MVAFFTLINFYGVKLLTLKELCFYPLNEIYLWKSDIQKLMAPLFVPINEVEEIYGDIVELLMMRLYQSRRT